MHSNNLKLEIFDFLYGQSNNFGDELTGGLYYIENPDDPQSVVYPYAVYQFVGGEYERDSLDKWINPIIQITIYDNENSSQRASELGEKLDERFDECENSLTVNGYSVLTIDRISPPREIVTLLGYWQHSRDYQIQMQLL